MKKDQWNLLKTLKMDELRVKLLEAEKAYGDLVLDKNTGKLKDLKAIFKKRKEIARISTLIQQKQSLEELESEVENTKEEGGSKELKS